MMTEHDPFLHFSVLPPEFSDGDGSNPFFSHWELSTNLEYAAGENGCQMGWCYCPDYGDLQIR
jgi:hypothetical protein